MAVFLSLKSDIAYSIIGPDREPDYMTDEKQQQEESLENARKRIRSRIREIARKRKNVTFDEVLWVMDQLGKFHRVGNRPAKHGMLFSIEGHRFMVSKHNPGSKQVKGYSVDDFLDVMSELGWFEG